MDNPEFTKHRDPHRWVVFSVICVVYFFVYFHRVSTSVIASDLLISFRTNATVLGFMSSMYFYLYALEQPIIGYLTDRIGPRKVIGYWSIAAAAGCFLFGTATNIRWASAGRAIIGLGVGGVYVPALMAISRWFRKKEFATMVGFLIAVGNFGAVIATTPLAAASETWGWRPTFFLIGGITLGMAFATLLFMRDNPRSTEPVQANLEKVYFVNPDLGSKLRRVLTSRQFWILAALFFIFYGMLVTLQGLWATPFLMSALGIERIFASKINMLIPVGVVIGAPLIGWMVDRFSINKRNTLIVILAVFNLLWLGIIFFFGVLGAMGLSLVFLLFGLAAGGFISIFWGVLQDINPPEILGLTLGMLNPAPLLGVAAFQVLTGAILNRATRFGELCPVSGFKNAFLVCLLGIVICTGLSFFIHKTKP
jgi:MFS family permease